MGGCGHRGFTCAGKVFLCHGLLEGRIMLCVLSNLKKMCDLLSAFTSSKCVKYPLNRWLSVSEIFWTI
jgi:hypothetical protein